MLDQDHFEKLTIVILVLDGPCIQKIFSKKPPQRRTMPQVFHDVQNAAKNPPCIRLRHSAPALPSTRAQCASDAWPRKPGGTTRKPASVQLNPLGHSGPFYHATALHSQQPFSHSPINFQYEGSGEFRRVRPLRGSSPAEPTRQHNSNNASARPAWCPTFRVFSIRPRRRSRTLFLHPSDSPPAEKVVFKGKYSIFRAPHSAFRTGKALNLKF